MWVTVSDVNVVINLGATYLSVATGKVTDPSPPWALSLKSIDYEVDGNGF